MFQRGVSPINNLRLARQRVFISPDDADVVLLKEYYEIVGESRPLSAFFPKHADFFTEMHF